VVLTVSLNLILGYGGMASMAHAAFFCIGGYVSTMPIRLTQVGALDPTMSDYPRTILEFKHLFPVRRPAIAIWSVFGGPKGVQIPVLWLAGR